jgi:hypothetical protein
MREHVTPGKQTEREIAAWEVAKRAGLEDLVAPVIEYEHEDHGLGALIAWQVGEIAEHHPDPFDGEEDMARAAIFDYVIGNADRHKGNWLVGEDGKLRLIDHGLAFPDNVDKDTSSNQQFEEYFAGFFEAAKSDPPRYQFFLKAVRDTAEQFLKSRERIADAVTSVGLSDEARFGVDYRIGKLKSLLEQIEEAEEKAKE